MSQAHRKRRKSRQGSRTRSQRGQTSTHPMLFGWSNYVFMLVALAMIISGYTGMALENRVEGVFSLYFAPLLILGGFALVIAGILRPDKTKHRQAGSNTSPDEEGSATDSPDSGTSSAPPS